MFDPIFGMWGWGPRLFDVIEKNPLPMVALIGGGLLANSMHSRHIQMRMAEADARVKVAQANLEAERVRQRGPRAV